MRVLVCTESKPDSATSAAFASQLGLIDNSELTLLGIAHSQDDIAATEAVMQRVGEQLNSAASIDHVLRVGDPSHEIMIAAGEKDFDLVVISRHKRRRLPPRMSRSGTQTLARSIPSHLLLVRNPPEHVRKILVCSSGEIPSIRTLPLAGKLIAPADAEVSLIHVMSQVALRLDSPASELEESAGEAIERRTLEGDRLTQGIRLLAEAGVQTPILPVLRHGLVVDEVLTEIESGGYDLVVLGSHYQPGLTRWMDILLDDVANALVDKVACSLLIIAPEESEEAERTSAS
jgi:nucleotide-binding universal stress UspA family protein